MLKEAQKRWAEEKYFIMSRSQAAYESLRQLFANNDWSEEKEEVFRATVRNVHSLPPSAGAYRNAAEHVWGYFKKQATEEEKQTFFRLLEQVEQPQEREAIRRYLADLTKKYQVTYLQQTTFLTIREEIK